MEFKSGHTGYGQAIFDLFTTAFAASEGSEEGRLIGSFVRNMMDTVPSDDLLVWSAREKGVFLGCIFLSRLTFPQDTRTVFILSPVAIKPSCQNTGIGQKLITHGLHDLRRKGVNFVVTYGDPNYYSKTGFHLITEAFAQPPVPLNFPEGWLGQFLSNENEKPLIGPSICVQPLNKAELW